MRAARLRLSSASFASVTTLIRKAICVYSLWSNGRSTWNNATLFHAMATLSIFRAHQPPSGPDPSSARTNEAELTQQSQIVEQGSFGRRALQAAVDLLKSSLPAIGQDLQDLPLPFSQVVTDPQRCGW